MIKEAKRLIKDADKLIYPLSLKDINNSDALSQFKGSREKLKAAIKDQQLNQVNVDELFDDAAITLNENTTKIVEAITAASTELSRELNYLTNQIRNLR
jgi:response regulator of citrate/malate metabolism